MDANLRTEGGPRLGPPDTETWKVLVEEAGRAGTRDPWSKLGVPDRGPALSRGLVVCAEPPTLPSGFRRLLDPIDIQPFPGLRAPGVDLTLGRYGGLAETAHYHP